MNIPQLYRYYSEHFLADTDTRSIRKNTMFFALKGPNFNGNTFAEKALSLGASYAIVDEKEYQTHPNILLVSDVLTTLQDLAKYHRQLLNTTIIGLTGSNGKTTTKELIHAVLSKKYNTVATKGNLNNHIGVPLTLLAMHPDTEMGIVEMGANHQKEIEFLSNICAPDYGYITNFGKAHLEGFGGVEGVIAGKSELYTFLQTHNSTAFINPEDPLQVSKTKAFPTIPFADDVQLIAAAPFVAVVFKNQTIQSNLVGSYNYANIAIAITVGNYFKVPQKDIQVAIENYQPTNNRSQYIKQRTNKIILDAYNANPSSIQVALENFKAVSAAQKVVILGDMFELGSESRKEHQNIIQLALSMEFKHCYFIGAHFYQTQENAHLFQTFEDFAAYLKGHAISNSTVLIKGSRGMRLERVMSLL
jgi:UDP-N-acetylmuramoyl-tripeptide--D-alanyl-D-alanine ligase